MMYRKYFKRVLDIILSGTALLVLSPVLLILTVIGFFQMKGNPFFYQERPGKDEKIFKLIKFRTMTNKKDSNGMLLPDIERMNRYGVILRSTSLDELPELFNILKGDMSFIGPRPLMARYLEYYTNEEKHRHDVKPGLTGYAQIKGRNSLSWDERFQFDLYYVNHLSFLFDIKIFVETVKIVIKRDNIELGDLGNLDDSRQKNIR